MLAAGNTTDTWDSGKPQKLEFEMDNSRVWIHPFQATNAAKKFTLVIRILQLVTSGGITIFRTMPLSYTYIYLIPKLMLRWLTTVLMEYKGTIFNSSEKDSKLFFPSLFNACLSLLSFYVKFQQLNVNKWPKLATEHPMRDWALVG